MRKNKMMRAASALLVAVLLTTCAISGTFAKYVTTDDFSDAARVAKWGVELQIFGNLFSDTYIETPVVDDATDLTVQAVNYDSQDTDIVAPGTSNTEGFKISLTGKPEVDGQIEASLNISNIYLKKGNYGVMVPVSVTITEENYEELYQELFYLDDSNYVSAPETFTDGRTYFTLENYNEVMADYYPVIFTLAGDTVYNTGVATADSLAGVADAIADKLGMTAGTVANGVTTYTTANPTTTTFNANTDLASEYDLSNLVITWAWAFSDQDNGADTILGLLENINTLENHKVVKYDSATNKYVSVKVNTDYCLNVEFGMAITVSQVD